MEHLFRQLERYAGEDIYPYHMPGHKRRAWGMLPRQLYEMDITEIEGFDNLQQPEGILLELQKKAARIYGADQSFYLVNGSTCGILCALSAALPSGGHVLMARNCHRSAYHGVYLRNLKVSYLWPHYLEEYDIYDVVMPQEVEEALGREPDIEAVLIVSPTYEGRIADVAAIAEVTHRKGIPLIVDEAHGAHLGLAEGFAPNSCQAGADLVVHSVHKTLPSLTQTALLHVNGDRIDRGLLNRFLHIYQSSSPSYLLMASIDNALQYVESEGHEAFERFRRFYEKMMTQLAGCRHLRFLCDIPAGYGDGGDDIPVGQEEILKDKFIIKEPGSFRQKGILTGNLSGWQDIGKLLISVKHTALTGRRLYEILLEKYHLQTEMAAQSYVLVMFTINDGEEAYRRMTEALLEIDEGLTSCKAEDFREGFPCEKGTQGEKMGRPGQGASFKASAREARSCGHVSCGDKFPPALAWDMSGEEILLEESVGRYAREFINLYPPGIPLLVPGERMTQELCREIGEAWEQGLVVQGIRIQEDPCSRREKACLYVSVLSREAEKLFSAIIDKERI